MRAPGISLPCGTQLALRFLAAFVWNLLIISGPKEAGCLLRWKASGRPSPARKR